MTPLPKECACKIHVVFHDDHVSKPTVMQQWIEKCSLCKSAPALLEALKTVVAWFERMEKDHSEKLGKSFEEACQNWDSILQEPLDMKPIQAAIAEAITNICQK